jgi:hypothetical protein
VHLCTPPPQLQKAGRRGRLAAGSYRNALLHDQDTCKQVTEVVQLRPPDPGALAAPALHEEQHVCRQRVRYVLERVRQLIGMVRKEKVE